MDIKIFEKIIEKGILKSPETMDFLKGQAREIFELTYKNWASSQLVVEDIKDPELWCEFYRKSEIEFERYLNRWFRDIFIQSQNYNPNLPNSISGIFENFIDEVLDHINFSRINFPITIMEDIFKEFIEKKGDQFNGNK